MSVLQRLKSRRWSVGYFTVVAVVLLVGTVTTVYVLRHINSSGSTVVVSPDNPESPAERSEATVDNQNGDTLGEKSTNDTANTGSAQSNLPTTGLESNPYQIIVLSILSFVVTGYLTSSINLKRYL